MKSGNELLIVDKDLFSSRLRKMRIDAGLSQKDCFLKIRNGIKADVKTLRNWENGFTLPSLDDLYSICNLFDCDSDYLLGFQDFKKGKFSDISQETGLNYNVIEKLNSVVESEKNRSLNNLNEKTFYTMDFIKQSIENYDTITFNNIAYDLTDENEVKKLYIAASPFLKNLNNFLMLENCDRIINTINMFLSFVPTSTNISGFSENEKTIYKSGSIENCFIIDLIRILQDQKELKKDQ